MFKVLAALVEGLAAILFFIPVALARPIVSICLFFGVLAAIKGLVNLF
jgi:hypothetical protein